MSDVFVFVFGCVVSAHVLATPIYLENARLKAGIDLDRGAMLTHFEDKRGNSAGLGNLINWVGSQIVFRGNGYTATMDCSAISSHFLSADGKTLSVTINNARNANTGSAMAASYSLRYELHETYLSVFFSFTDSTGKTNPKTDHETPALYAVSKLSNFTCYTGSSAWSGGALTTWTKPPFWGGNGDAYKAIPSDECWCAWTDASTGYSLGLYTPGVGTILMGRLNPDTFSTDPNAEARSYAAPLMRCAVQSGQTISGVYHLTVGSLSEIRRTFAAIRFGMANGEGLGAGDVRVDPQAGDLSISAFDPRAGQLTFHGRFVGLNGGRTSDEFALVCRTNLSDGKFLMPVTMTLDASGENAQASIAMPTDDPPPSLFVSGLDTCPSPFPAQMRDKGFTESYVERLSTLHEAHPNWLFEPLFVTDMTWDAIVDKEMTPAWNLVVHSTWAADPWLSLGLANYTPYYAENAQAYDSGSFYQASRAAVAYFMDPRNFLNDTEVFMFETLGYDAASHTVSAVDKAFAGSFMANACYDGGSRTYAALLVEAGAEQGISPVFLAGRLTQEQGNGSVQARGTIGDSLWELYADEDGRVGNNNVWGGTYTKDNAATAAVIAQGKAHYNGYYNFFNMDAGGTGLFEIRYNAWREAYNAPASQFGPWTSQERAIRGGVVKMKNRYIGTQRHTRYLQKFSVLAEAGSSRWSQYMQNIASPLSESRSTKKAYIASGAYEDAHLFLVPVYRDMPADPCPDPANGNSVYSPTR